MAADAHAAWLLAAPFLALGLLTIAGNVAIVLYRHRSISLLPLAGGLLTSAGLLLAPHGPHTPWWWLPLCLDPGCLPAVVGLLVSRRHSADGPPT